MRPLSQTLSNMIVLVEEIVARPLLEPTIASDKRR